MPLVTGILLDVSGSMKQYVNKDAEVKPERWVKSIFKVADQIIKHDVSSDNEVFILAFGGSSLQVFDLISTLKKGQRNYEKSSNTKYNMLEEAVDILEANGAPRIRHWASMEVLMEAVSEFQVSALLATLNNNPEFRRNFISDCLPEVCRTTADTAKEASKNAVGMVSFLDKSNAAPFLVGGAYGLALLSGPVGIGATCLYGSGFAFSKLITHGAADTANKSFDKATTKEVKEAVEKGMKLYGEEILVGLDNLQIMNVNKAREVLHGSIGDEDELSNQRVNELLDFVEPIIYGNTPLIETLQEAKEIFSLEKYKDYHKFLFVLSDGEPTDGQDPPILDLSNLDVISTVKRHFYLNHDHFMLL